MCSLSLSHSVCTSPLLSSHFSSVVGRFARTNAVTFHVLVSLPRRSRGLITIAAFLFLSRAPIIGATLSTRSWWTCACGTVGACRVLRGRELPSKRVRRPITMPSLPKRLIVIGAPLPMRRCARIIVSRVGGSLRDAIAIGRTACTSNPGKA